MSLMEVCAVGLAVAYVLLAVYQRRLCWIAAIASAALYIVIFWQVQLYLEAALQVFYIAMAIVIWKLRICEAMFSKWFFDCLNDRLQIGILRLEEWVGTVFNSTGHFGLRLN